MSCVSDGPTIEEYNLAEVAYRSAEESEANKFAPIVLSKARRLKRRGERALKERNFEESLKLFRKSRFYSEKAENISRLKMFTEGEMIP